MDAHANEDSTSPSSSATIQARRRFPKFLLRLGFVVGEFSVLGSIIHRATFLQCEPYRLFAGGPAKPMQRVLPCSLESTAALIALTFIWLQELLGAFQETRELSRWFSASMLIIVQQRGAFALDIAHYDPLWISLHFFSVAATYLGFIIRTAESEPSAYRRNKMAVFTILAVSLATHVDAYLTSELFKTGFYTVAISAAGAIDTGLRLTDLRSLRNVVLYSAAWLSFKRLFGSVERQRGGTLTTRHLLVGMRWYVLLSFLLRLKLRDILNSGPEGFMNAWIFEDFVLNGPILLYGIVLLQCIGLDRTVQLELETEVTLARKRQALAEALVAGRNAFTRFVFHEVRVPLQTVRLGIDHLREVCGSIKEAMPQQEEEQEQVWEEMDAGESAKEQQGEEGEVSYPQSRRVPRSSSARLGAHKEKSSPGTGETGSDSGSANNTPRPAEAIIGGGTGLSSTGNGRDADENDIAALIGSGTTTPSSRCTTAPVTSSSDAAGTPIDVSAHRRAASLTRRGGAAANSSYRRSRPASGGGSGNVGGMTSAGTAASGRNSRANGSGRAGAIASSGTGRSRSIDGGTPPTASAATPAATPAEPPALSRLLHDLPQHFREASETLDLMTDASGEMSSILDDVLMIQKIQAGEFQLSMKPADIGAIAANSVRFFRLPARERRVELSLQVDPRLPRHLLLDEQRVLQTANNLISNGLKFVPEGSGRVGLSVKLEGLLKLPLGPSVFRLTSAELQGSTCANASSSTGSFASSVAASGAAEALVRRYRSANSEGSSSTPAAGFLRGRNDSVATEQQLSKDGANGSRSEAAPAGSPKIVRVSSARADSHTAAAAAASVAESRMKGLIAELETGEPVVLSWLGYRLGRVIAEIGVAVSSVLPGWLGRRLAQQLPEPPLIAQDKPKPLRKLATSTSTPAGAAVSVPATPRHKHKQPQSLQKQAELLTLLPFTPRAGTSYSISTCTPSTGGGVTSSSQSSSAASTERGRSGSGGRTGSEGSGRATDTDWEPSDDVAIVTLTCSDNGCGMRREDADRLFQAFMQVDGGANQQGKGTGLGLSICREIIHKHGGDITVQSEVGRGSVFTVTLPLRVMQQKEAAETDGEGDGIEQATDRTPAQTSASAAPSTGAEDTASQPAGRVAIATGHARNSGSSGGNRPAAADAALPPLPRSPGATGSALAQRNSGRGSGAATANNSKGGRAATSTRSGSRPKAAAASSGVAQSSAAPGGSKSSVSSAAEATQVVPPPRLLAAAGATTSSAAGSSRPLSHSAAQAQAWSDDARAESAGDYDANEVTAGGSGGNEDNNSSRFVGVDSSGLGSVQRHGRQSSTDTDWTAGLSSSLGSTGSSLSTDNAGARFSVPLPPWPAMAAASAPAATLALPPSLSSSATSASQQIGTGGASSYSNSGIGTVTSGPPSQLSSFSSSSTTSSQSSLTSRPIHVLVVDDQPSNRKLLARALLRQLPGSIVDEAADGLEAVEAVRRNSPDRYDAITMDSQMPRMGGHDATRTIRGECGYGGVLLGVTANALVDDIQAFVGAGATHVLTKPVNVSELAGHIREARKARLRALQQQATEADEA